MNKNRTFSIEDYNVKNNFPLLCKEGPGEVALGF
ncbi:hypothetical protein BH23BAC3_BH23BAC3_26290 [soil metagenome]